MELRRDDSITGLCSYIRTNSSDFNLVRPYYGELDRYDKKKQIQAETFPATVNLTTPFCLVVSKRRRQVASASKGNRIILRHEISLYVGTQNRHDFLDTTTPEIFTFLSNLADLLVNKALFKRRADRLILVDEGNLLIMNDLFIVYDQQWEQDEIAF